MHDLIIHALSEVLCKCTCMEVANVGMCYYTVPKCAMQHVAHESDKYKVMRWTTYIQLGKPC